MLIYVLYEDTEALAAMQVRGIHATKQGAIAHVKALHPERVIELREMATDLGGLRLFVAPKLGYAKMNEYLVVERELDP